MTIHGDGSSLVTYDVPPGMLPPEHLDAAIGELFTRLVSDEVNFDTTSWKIEFPYGEGQHDMTGATTWTRIFTDWVFLQLQEMDVSDEVLQSQTLVMNGLHKCARQHLGLE
jgi:hypothetical protein